MASGGSDLDISRRKRWSTALEKGEGSVRDLDGGAIPSMEGGGSVAFGAAAATACAGGAEAGGGGGTSTRAASATGRAGTCDGGGAGGGTGTGIVRTGFGTASVEAGAETTATVSPVGAAEGMERVPVPRSARGTAARTASPADTRRTILERRTNRTLRVKSCSGTPVMSGRRRPAGCATDPGGVGRWRAKAHVAIPPVACRSRRSAPRNGQAGSNEPQRGVVGRATRSSRRWSVQTSATWLLPVSRVAGAGPSCRTRCLQDSHRPSGSWRR